jgi:hypothetical protein
MKTAVTFLLLLFTFSTAVSQGLHQIEAAPTVILKGKAEWYYWKNSGSDTCLVWLGGGKAFADHVTINPYYLESLNTLRYIQDLSTQYSVLALYKGPDIEYVYEADSRVSVLSYYDDSKFLHEVYEWIRENGYAYSYLVGYSTGGTVVGYELAVRDRNTWISPNGGIIVSGRVDQPMKYWKGTSLYESAAHARKIQANILLLYGRIWSEDLWPQGQEYYEKAPSDGRIGGRWYHKEWHLFNESGHEVWTRERTGIYDPTAFHITVKFIEKSKTLSLKSEEEAISRALTSSSVISNFQNVASIADIESPKKAHPGQLLKVRVTVKYSFREETRIATVLWDIESRNLVSVSERIVQGDGVGVCGQLTYAPSDEKNWSLAAVVLIWSKDQAFVMKPILLEVAVSNKHLLSIQTDYSNISIVVDNVIYRTDREGKAQIEVEPGVHTIETQEIVPIDEGSRLVFRNWQDGFNSNRITVNTNDDETLSPVYIRQYLVTVNSSYGETEGAGWYDENTKARIAINPESLKKNTAGIFQEEYVFESWSGDATGVDPQIEITVDRPKLVIATWRTGYGSLIQTIAVLSLVVSAALIVFFGYRSFRARL